MSDYLTPEEAENLRQYTLREFARAHIEAVIPQWRRQYVATRAVVALDEARQGRPLPAKAAARANANNALLRWEAQVLDELDDAIENGTLPDAVSFTVWTG